MKEKISKVRLSYGRCMMSKGFFDDFYDHFFRSSPEVRRMFKDTNMGAQKKLLQNGISYMIMFADGSQMAKSKMGQLGQSHAEGGMNVNPELYRHWINALIETIEKHDQKIDDDTVQNWKDVINVGIDRMKQMHTKPGKQKAA